MNVFVLVFANVKVPETDVVPVTPSVKFVPVVNPAPASIVKLPFTDKFTAPVVVVPKFIFKLLKEVTTAVGKVLLAVIFTVPVLGVQVDAVFEPLTTNESTFKTDPEVIVTIPLLAPVLPNVIVEAESVEPETNVMVPFLLLFPDAPS
ncbi:hypothetical protein D3C85_598130 [compost metagenome]